MYFFVPMVSCRDQDESGIHQPTLHNKLIPQHVVFKNQRWPHLDIIIMIIEGMPNRECYCDIIVSTFRESRQTLIMTTMYNLPSKT